MKSLTSDLPLALSQCASSDTFGEGAGEELSILVCGILGEMSILEESSILEVGFDKNDIQPTMGMGLSAAIRLQLNLDLRKVIIIMADVPRKKIMADLQHAFVRRPDTDGFHIKSLDLEGSLQVSSHFSEQS